MQPNATDFLVTRKELELEPQVSKAIFSEHEKSVELAATQYMQG